jgi:predicted nucleic acid-binding Zn ribbon protein
MNLEFQVLPVLWSAPNPKRNPRPKEEAASKEPKQKGSKKKGDERTVFLSCRTTTRTAVCLFNS